MQKTKNWITENHYRYNDHKYLGIKIIDEDGERVTFFSDVDKNYEANANRIVQMNNSFDDLLEACKDALRTIDSELYDPLSIKQLKSAIAKAEGN